MRKQHLILIAVLVFVAACSREQTDSATGKITEGSAEVVEGVKEGTNAAAGNVADAAKDAADATKEAAGNAADAVKQGAADMHDKAAGDH